MSRCVTISQGCGNWLQKIYKLLCTFFDMLVTRFISGVTIYSNQKNWIDGARVVSSVPARIEYYSFFNNKGIPVYVKLYNANASADVDPLTDKPYLPFLVPAGGGENVAETNIHFDEGIVVRVTDSAASTAIDYPADDTVIVNIGYKNL